VLDVGANIGLFAVYTKLKHPDSILHCYEPAPNTLPLFEANTRAFSGITMHPYGLFNRDQDGTLYLHGANSGQSSIHRPPGLSEAASITLRDAGEEWDRLGWDHVDILKIDTEGCEVAILESLGPRLDRVDYVLLEHHGDDDRRRIDALLGDFELFGSKLYAVGTGTAKYIHRRLMIDQPRPRFIRA
jgi:FkbM family methyltransferase